VRALTPADAPASLRHTAAHDWLLNGGQERELMRLLGWRSESMLSRYGASASTTARCMRHDA